MRRALLLSALLLAGCGKPEDDGDLKAAFAASALKDPSSVQLRNVQANKEVICGEYNSKNSYGAYGGYEPFVFKRNIKDLWLGDSDNEYSHSAFWNECPNNLELGLTGGSTALTTDMNAVDMNATDPALEAADDALENAANAVANAQEAISDSGDVETEPNYDANDTGDYDVNNDAGE
jgi:hypothetical protein